MMRNKGLWAALSCVAVLGLTAGCSDDDSVCGDGVAEGSEQCDLADLGGATCADAVPGSTGTLACTAACTFDTTLCGALQCGNGINEFGEICDCGTDLSNLPAGCTDVNGGANANCSATCTQVDLCGDGEVTGDEECDCGDPTLVSSVPGDCDDYNDPATSACYDDCTINTAINCEGELYDDCEILDQGFCCEDEYGVQLECKTSMLSGGDNTCARSCTAASECPWNNICFGSINPTYDMCFYSQCGPGDVIDSEFYTSCDAFGNTGTCIPFGRYSDTKDFYGFCFEPGDLGHGVACPTSNATPPVSLLGTDRDIAGGAAASMCSNGLCLAVSGATEGTCAQFCDWETEYEALFYGGTSGSLACPTDSNCWAEATISEDSVSPYADFGYRSAGIGYCQTPESVDPDGMTTCSLVTGELLSNTSNDCTDSHTNGRCVLVRYNVDYHDANGSVISSGTEVTMGSLIGTCMDTTGTEIANVWDTCDPAADVCPLGSSCVEEDVFDTAAGATRCIPYCDTEHHGLTGNPTCQDLGAADGDGTADSTPICTSVSYTYGTGGAEDPSKSRLGYCALPRP